MIFNNYTIPDNITEEETFFYNLMNQLYNAGSHYGFVMGDFSLLIDKMKKANVSEELIQEAEKVFSEVVSHLSEYNKDIYNFALQRWEELGQPLSIAAHIEKKKRLDAEDDYKAKYCDR